MLVSQDSSSSLKSIINVTLAIMKTYTICLRVVSNLKLILKCCQLQYLGQ